MKKIDNDIEKLVIADCTFILGEMLKLNELSENPFKDGSKILLYEKKKK